MISLCRVAEAERVPTARTSSIANRGPGSLPSQRCALPSAPHVSSFSLPADLIAKFSLGESTAQLLGSQCSGAAILHRLRLVDNVTVCTDVMTSPMLEALGVSVVNEAFRANGNLTTSGGCLPSAYLAFWMISRLVSVDAATTAMEYVAPIGELADYAERALAYTAVGSAPS